MNGFRVPIAKARKAMERRLLLAVQEWEREECEAIDVVEAACAWADYQPKPRRRRSQIGGDV